MCENPNSECLCSRPLLYRGKNMDFLLLLFIVSEFSVQHLCAPAFLEAEVMAEQEFLPMR